MRLLRLIALWGLVLAPAAVSAQGTLNGMPSGNTSAFVTTTGAQTSGNCVRIDVDGNHIASDAACVTEVLAFVAADVTHASSNTTMADVTGLSLAIASATEIWGFTCTLLATSNGAAADFDFNWSAVAPLSWLDLGASGVAFGTAPSDSTLQVRSYGGRNGTTIIAVSGTTLSGAGATTTQLQFAQHTSSVNTTIISKGSWCLFSRLAV